MIINQIFVFLSIGSFLSVVSGYTSLVTEKDFKWSVKTRGNTCSRPCNGGYRNVTYHCISYDDPTGVTMKAEEEDCDEVNKPPPEIPCNTQACFLGNRARRTATKRGRYEWLFTGQWSACINGCFKGKQCQMLSCFDNLKDEWKDDKECAKAPRPVANCQVCRDYVSCPAVWSISGWSTCSKTCGRGTRVRSVSCVKQVDAINIMILPDKECPGDVAPKKVEVCAAKDCPPKFVTTKWSKCIGASSWSCGIGTKKRKVTCAHINKKGRFQKLPFRVCYKQGGRSKYPKPWEPCRDYTVPLSEECKAKQKDSDIFIHKINATVVQMRRSKRLTLQVGETAYVFPRTNVVIKCPITGFDARDLVWFHNSRPVSVNGRRIHMNYRGRLKIKRLRRRDIGSWRCMARNQSAKLSLRLRHPSDGFREYAVRLPLIRLQAQNQMLSDSPGGGSTSEYGDEAVQWVTDPWSTCSSSCGPVGKMVRKVQCERLKDDFYKVYDDEACIKKGLPKPTSVKTCGGLKECPKWKVNEGTGKCTDVCVSVGRAILKDKVYCVIGQQLLPKHSCDPAKKPLGLDFCNNTECMPKWRVSPWSQCSRSCGGQGVMARHLECVWRKSGVNAGSNCYKENIIAPQVIRNCKTPACNLACVDLTVRCKTIQARQCRFVPYQRFCCDTCVKALKGKSRP